MQPLNVIALCTVLLCCLFSTMLFAQESLYSNATHPDMLPALSTVGKYTVGVKTRIHNNTAYVNPLTQTQGRNLTLEVWYPTQKETRLSTYTNELRSGKVFSIRGHAFRDAPFDDSGQWPLIVLSHGYTGYRTIMFYLGEHLASHGYVVVGIDHTDSTNADVDVNNAPFAGFMSTLLHRSRDQQTILDAFSDAAFVQKVFIKETLWQAEKAGVIGYSMGGYGAINTIGGCFNFPEALLGQFLQTDDSSQITGIKSVLDTCSAGQSHAQYTIDPKWKAMIAIAPWGGQHRLFQETDLAKVTVPSLFMSGDHDDVSNYAGIQSIYNAMKSNDAYFLTYVNARHNIAPHPAPSNAWDAEIDFGHYYESAWSNERLNHINQHFTLAMMDCYLKKDVDKCEFLDLSTESHQLNKEGSLGKPWRGFDHRYSTGMRWKMKKSQ